MTKWECTNMPILVMPLCTIGLDRGNISLDSVNWVDFGIVPLQWKFCNCELIYRRLFPTRLPLLIGNTFHRFNPIWDPWLVEWSISWWRISKELNWGSILEILGNWERVFYVLFVIGITISSSICQQIKSFWTRDFVPNSCRLMLLTFSINMVKLWNLFLFGMNLFIY